MLVRWFLAGSFQVVSLGSLAGVEPFYQVKRIIRGISLHTYERLVYFSM